MKKRFYKSSFSVCSSSEIELLAWSAIRDHEFLRKGQVRLGQVGSVSNSQTSKRVHIIIEDKYRGVVGLKQYPIKIAHHISYNIDFLVGLNKTKHLKAISLFLMCCYPFHYFHDKVIKVENIQLLIKQFYFPF